MVQGLGNPVKLLHEAVGHVCTVELNTGEIYRGKLIEAEDSFNLQMTDITMTARDGQVSKMQRIFVRGSKVRFMIVPDMLKNAPMFSMTGTQRGLGRGKVGMIRAQGSERRGGGRGPPRSGGR